MKHLLLSATLLLFASNLTAQLYVQPNPVTTTDSYVYANDVVLYVEGGINLVENNTAETEASIYLRGDAQLIQGDKVASLNSGTGSISVWQRGFANAFDYNYWASPVGVPTGAAGNTNFGISRIFDVRQDTPLNLHPTRSTPQSTVTGLNGVASSVENGVEGTLGVSRRWIYTMRALSGYNNWIFISQNPNLAPGEGFTMKGTGTSGYAEFAHNQLYDFRGRPNDGRITVNVNDGQETLTGNPYPSTLDMANFLLDAANVGVIEGYARFWDQSRTTNTHYIADYEGGYGVWVPNLGGTVPPEYGGGTTGVYTAAPFLTYDGSGTQTGTTGFSGAVYTGRFSPPGQGFMVIGSAGTTGTATINNTMRRYVPYGAAFNNEHKSQIGSSLSTSAGQVPNLPTEPEHLFPTLRFHVEINDLYTRDMVMAFASETTKGKDRGWDAKHPKLINSGDAYWILEDETDPFVIQTRPFDEFDVIPLGIRKGNGNASYKVVVAEAHGFTNNMYLFDLQNNHYQRLDLQNKAQINLNGPAGNIENRFYIVFRRAIQDDQIPNKIAEMNLDFFQNNRLSQLEVFNPETIDIKSASVYDMSGKLVIHEKNLGMQNRYSFSTANLSSGVYLVKLVTADDIIVDYKVTVHNK